MTKEKLIKQDNYEDSFSNYYYENELISEEEKNSSNYLIYMVDKVIRDLNYDKLDLKKAAMYYNRTRDNNEFCYLWESEGLANPGELPFVSLILPRIKVLVGVHLQHRFNYFISCRGNDALTLIEEEKKTGLLNKIYNEIVEDIQARLKLLTHFAKPDEQSKQLKIQDELYQKKIDKLILDYDAEFISEIEILSQDVLNDLVSKLNIKNLSADLFEHLLIYGQCYYRTFIDNLGETPQLDICNPRHFYYKKHDYKKEVSQSNQCFYKMYMTKTEILNKFGAEMTLEEKKELSNRLSLFSYDTDNYWDLGLYQQGTVNLLNEENSNINQYQQYKYQDKSFHEYICVYHSEWLSNNEYITTDKNSQTITKYRMDRYEGYRIGGEAGIYLKLRKSPYVVRDLDFPDKCTLSYNGIIQANVNSTKPESMVLLLKQIQDDYDITLYLRKQAESQFRLGGLAIDVASLPKLLGGTMEERLEKVLQYRKNANIYLMDSSQEGILQGGQNASIQDYPSNVDLNFIQACNQILEQLEALAADITGVNRQMMGQMEERDGAAVTKQALMQTSLSTKTWFTSIDRVTECLLTDLLELSRISYEIGQKGAYLLGTKQKIYSINNLFKLSSYSVYVSDSGQEETMLAKLEQFIQPFAQNGTLDMDLALELVTTNSVSKMKSTILNKKKAKENSELEQMKQQLEQINKQMEETNKELEKLKKLDLDTKAKELSLQERKVITTETKLAHDKELKEKNLQAKTDAEKQRNEIEKIQAVNGGKDKEVKNVSW
jgi:hypothetical protein